MVKHKILIISIIIIVLLGCSSKKPRLKIGLNADYPPFEYRQDEALAGLDVDLAKELGKSLGYGIDFVEMEFDELLPALNSRKIDLAISAITINEQRKQLVDFSIPYFCADQALICREEAEIAIEELTEIANYQIGMQNGTTGQYYLQYNLVEKDLLSWQNLTSYDNNNQAISALINAQIDLLIMDDSAAKAFSEIKPLKVVHIIRTDEQYGIAMRKGYELKANINTALLQILNSNFWTNTITRYMGK